LINDNLSTTHISLGAGIDENTALVVDGDNALILGEEGVSFFDLS
jgi:cyanophycinase-like exopeptidase